MGCWQFGVRSVHYFGSVRGLSYHVVGIDDSLYLLADVHDLAAFPILREELETIESQLA